MPPQRRNLQVSAVIAAVVPPRPWIEPQVCRWIAAALWHHPRQVHTSYCRICKTNELVGIITLGDTSENECPPENPSGQSFGGHTSITK